MKPFSTTNAFQSPLSRVRRLVRRPLYENANDRGRHMYNAERLAAEIQVPIEKLLPLYEDILASMKATASIPDYLPILVSKRVKFLLQH